MIQFNGFFINQRRIIFAMVVIAFINLLPFPALALANPNTETESLEYNTKTLPYTVTVDFLQCMAKEGASKLLMPATEAACNEHQYVIGPLDALMRSLGDGLKQNMAANLVAFSNDPEKMSEAIINTTSALLFVVLPMETAVDGAILALLFYNGHALPPGLVESLVAKTAVSFPRNILKSSEEVLVRGQYGSQLLVPLTQWVLIMVCPPLVGSTGLNENWIFPVCMMISTAGATAVVTSYICLNPKYEQFDICNFENLTVQKGWETFKKSTGNMIPIFFHNLGSLITSVSYKVAGGTSQLASKSYLLNQLTDSASAAFIKAAKHNMPNKEDPNFTDKMQQSLDDIYTLYLAIFGVTVATQNPWALMTLAKIVDRGNREILSIKKVGGKNDKDWLEIIDSSSAMLKVGLPLCSLGHIMVCKYFYGQAPDRARDTIFLSSLLGNLLSALATSYPVMRDNPPTINGVASSIKDHIIALIVVPIDFYNYMNSKNAPEKEKVEL
jgi:hypothetical protein